MGYKTELQSNNIDLQSILDMILALGLVDKPEVEADTLDGCSWANIAEVAAKGNAANYWAVGDCKAVKLSGTVGTLALDTTLYVYILGFNHNGSTNTIDFGTFKTAATDGVDVCLIDSKYNSPATDGTKYFNMNHWGNYNYGGWAGCDLRYDVLGSTDVAPSGYGAAVASGRVGYDATETCATNPVSNTLMAAMPSDLRAVMKPMTIYTDNTGGATNTEACVTTSVDYLPLLAEDEIFGTWTYANEYEGNYLAQYTYYANGNSKVKYRHSATTSTSFWWERSPYYDSSNRFCTVYTGGGAYINNAVYSLGLAPAFRV